MALPSDWNSGGNALQPGTQKPGLWDILTALHGIATLAALKLISPLFRSDGMMARVTGGPAQGFWRYSAASVLGGDDLLVATPGDTPAAGRWHRDAGSFVDLILPFTFATADAAVLYTVPAGFRLAVDVPFWEIGTSMTGGTTPAIGLSSSNGGLSTAGDLLGGASGDLTATLVSTGAFAKGTVGAKIGKPSAILVGGDTIKFNRIASAFTAGAGNGHIPVDLLLSP